MSYTITTPTGEHKTFATIDELRSWVTEPPAALTPAIFQGALARINTLLHYMAKPETALEAARLLRAVPECRDVGVHAVLKEVAVRRAAQKGIHTALAKADQRNPQ